MIFRDSDAKAGAFGKLGKFTKIRKLRKVRKLRKPRKPRKPQPKGTVVVMYGRSLMSLVIAHSLGKRGYEVIGCDDVDLTVLSFSRYVKKNFVHAPLDGDREVFLSDLEAKLKRRKPSDGRPYILMPVFRETEIIAQYRERFEQFMQVAAPDFHAISKVHPKDQLVPTAESLGVRIPRTRVVPGQGQPGEQPLNIEELTRGMEFPLLIKPADEVGGRGIEKVMNATHLSRSLEYARKYFPGELLLQEFVPGEDYCLAVLFSKGELRASMAYKNIHRFPYESGAGSLRETVDETAFIPSTKRLLGPLGWNGVAELDFRWNGRADSEPYLIEVNPRFWAGLFQSVESGVDFPLLLLSLTLSGDVEPQGRIGLGKRTKIPGLWLLSAVQDVAASDEGFSQLSDVWDDAQSRIQNRELKEAFSVLSGSVESGIGLRALISRLRLIVREGRAAKNDVFYRDDPFIVLGIMFILGSLIRHRSLPPEIRSR
ncbi:MAG: ATP-grasp domain-containing protein [Spirochaetaceae bacterium]|nr:MAG: ATP-grasp domain-containing protein [Spirochaetaceae bacterium]